MTIRFAGVLTLILCDLNGIQQLVSVWFNSDSLYDHQILNIFIFTSMHHTHNSCIDWLKVDTAYLLYVGKQRYVPATIYLFNTNWESIATVPHWHFWIYMSTHYLVQGSPFSIKQGIFSTKLTGGVTKNWHTSSNLVWDVKLESLKK